MKAVIKLILEGLDWKNFIPECGSDACEIITEKVAQVHCNVSHECKKQFRQNQIYKEIIKLLETEGDVKIKKTFQSPYEQYKKRNGETFKVIEKITKPQKDIDAEVLPMYRIQFSDGEIILAWPEEIEED